MALLKQTDSVGKTAREMLIKSTRKSCVSGSQIPNTCPGVRMGDRCDTNEDQCCSRGLLWAGL